MVKLCAVLYFLDKESICEKMTGHRKLVLIRKESQQGLGAH